MKLQSFVIQQAIADGRYEDAVRLLLQHFRINLPGVQVHITTDIDIGYGIRAWVGSDPYEWYEGNFYFPALDGSAGRDYSRVEIVSATVWSKIKNS